MQLELIRIILAVIFIMEG